MIKKLTFILFFVSSFAQSQMIIDSYRFDSTPAPTLLPDAYGVAAYPNSTLNGMSIINVNAVSFGEENTIVRSGTTAFTFTGTTSTTHVRTNNWTPSGFADATSYTLSGWSNVQSGTVFEVRPYDAGGLKTGVSLSLSAGWNFWTYTWTSTSASTFRIYFYGDGEVVFDDMEMIEN